MICIFLINLTKLSGVLESVFLEFAVVFSSFPSRPLPDPAAQTTLIKLDSRHFRLFQEHIIGKDDEEHDHNIRNM